MRKFFFGIILTVTVLLVYKACTYQPKMVLVESSDLIKKQISNVGKLIVTEGHFSEVFNYKDSKQIFGNYITADKKALVVVNAEVTVTYDLSKIEYEVDEINKILTITKIPTEEISIYPELQYYDIQSDYLNPFEAKDYNIILDKVKLNLKSKIEGSSLKSNATNRLISELSKFYILTESFGWTLQYKAINIKGFQDLETLLF